MWRISFRIPIVNLAVGIVVARVAHLEAQPSADEARAGARPPR